MNSDVMILSRALVYAANAHTNQRRKGAAQEPYVNHLIEVMDILAMATDGLDTDLLVAALLHDVIEDCGISRNALVEAFGPRVARIVAENSDDMFLPKSERRRQRLNSMVAKPVDSRMVKMADVISNMRAVAGSAPAGWTRDQRLSYVADCRALIDAGRGTNPRLEAVFERTARDVEAILGDKPAVPTTLEERHLDNAIGEQVHLVYLANTDGYQALPMRRSRSLRAP